MTDKNEGGDAGVVAECRTDFALVQQVQIEAVDDHSVTFSTRATPVAGAATAEDDQRKTFSVPRTEVWTRPIAGAPPSVAMEPGAIGNLYLSRAGWQTTTPDGFQIFGAGTEHALFKYPWCAAGPRMLAHLSVVPTSIMVRGRLAGRSVAIELIDAAGDSEGAESQNILWSGATEITLRLTARGAARLGVATTVRMWPTQIVVTGSPASDLSVTGEVDLLDGACAGAVQHLAYDTRGQTVTLSLTVAGISGFHVEPQRRAS
jgi:hypothetical protein